MAVPPGLRIALPAQDTLGEGPFWHADTHRLIRVDIPRAVALSWNPLTGAEVKTTFDRPVSLAIPSSEGGLVAALEDRIVVTDGEACEELCRIEEDCPTTRLNDGKCDAHGRLWVGTYSLRGQAEGGLYHVDVEGQVRKVLEGLQASNGLAWSPDGSCMYVVDSGRGRIDCFDVTSDASDITAGRPFCELSPAEGLPDGIATDLEGGVWVAVFGGGCVRRYTAEGELDAEYRLPVTYPTSVAFGGLALDCAYVTTSRQRLSAHQRRREPAAGSVLSFTPGVAGVPVTTFGRRPQ